VNLAMNRESSNELESLIDDLMSLIDELASLSHKSNKI
jgi:hypothetical protein